MRDSNGNLIRGFSHNLGITNSLATELWGLQDRLLLTCDLNVSKLIIEINAKAVVDLINPVNVNTTTSHPYSALINDCRYLILSFNEVKIQHAHYESNFCADLLAKEGNKILDSYVIFVFPPHFVVSQLLADTWGVVYPCMLKFASLFNAISF